MRKIKKVLNDKKMGNIELAELTGRSERQVRRIVNGYSEGSVVWWRKAAKVLGVNMSDIIE